VPDYKTMQQEAIKKALDMQNRSRHNSSQNTPKETDVIKEEPLVLQENKKTDVFELLFKDSEKTLILILILLLLSEECDASLLLALIYLIL